MTRLRLNNHKSNPRGQNGHGFRKALSRLALGAATMLPAAGAAAQNDLGTFVGDTVVFEAVSTPGTTFSSPVVNGDLLNFATDSNFQVASFNGGLQGNLPQTRSAALRSVVERRGDASLTELDAQLLGGVNFFALNNVEATTFTRVTADIAFEVAVLEADGVELPAPVLLTGSETVFDLNAVDDADVSSPVGSFRFDLASEALAAGIVGGVTRIDWGVTVTFAAFSESFTASNLDFAGFSELVLTVPEPASGVLMVGVAGLCLVRRRAAA